MKFLCQIRSYGAPAADKFSWKAHHLCEALSSCSWQFKDGKKNSNSGHFEATGIH